MKPNSNQPAVDISIVTYNSAKWLDAFFSSLEKQAFPLNKIKVWVRDNGSTDNTLARLRELKSTCTDIASFEIEAGENIGFGLGHNSNLEKGLAPYLLVTNVDLTFERDAIVNCVNQALNDSENVASWEFRQKPFEHPKHYHPATLETTWSSSACILFRRVAIEKIGGYEPRIFLYGEDVEISYRLRDSGYLLRYCPSAVCWHYSYSNAHELKPLQILGSTLANCYIRLRYGNLLNILTIAPNLLYLTITPQRFQGQRIGQIKNIWCVIRNALYFLMSRKQSSQKFPIQGLDYEKTRVGAFYENKKLALGKPLVTIIVRTYKGRKSCLREAVASVLNQTYDNIELVVIEDGTETAKDFILELSNTGKLTAVKYKSIPKGGRCKAGNAGLAISSGNYVNFLDDDDLLFADHIEVLVQNALENPKVDALYSVAWEVKTDVISKESWLYEELGFNVVYQEPFNKGLLLVLNYIPIQSILFKRSLYIKHGGFNENLLVLEDWELWLRYAVESEFLLVKKLTSLYRVPSDGKAAIARWEELNGSYNDVIAATDSIKMHITAGEMRLIADTVADRKFLFKVKKERLLKLLFVKLPFAPLLYRLLKRIY